MCSWRVWLPSVFSVLFSSWDFRDDLLCDSCDISELMLQQKLPRSDTGNETRVLVIIGWQISKGMFFFMMQNYEVL